MSTLTTATQDQKIKEAVLNTSTGIKDNPDAAQATFEAASKFEQGFRAEYIRGAYHHSTAENRLREINKNTGEKILTFRHGSQSKACDGVELCNNE